MKVYNKDKTKILTNYDLSKGRLIKDILVHHIPAVEAEEGKSHLEVIKTYKNGGKDVKTVIDKPAVSYCPAHDETEDILVFIPYTKQEILENKQNNLRQIRISLLDAFDKWEKAVLRGREEDDPNIMLWFEAIKDLDEDAFTAIPDRITYYLTKG